MNKSSTRRRRGKKSIVELNPSSAFCCNYSSVSEVRGGRTFSIIPLSLLCTTLYYLLSSVRLLRWPQTDRQLQLQLLTVRVSEQKRLDWQFLSSSIFVSLSFLFFRSFSDPSSLFITRLFSLSLSSFCLSTWPSVSHLHASHLFPSDVSPEFEFTGPSDASRILFCFTWHFCSLPSLLVSRIVDVDPIKKIYLHVCLYRITDRTLILSVWCLSFHTHVGSSDSERKTDGL